MSLFWVCYEFAVVLLCFCYDVAMVLHWLYYEFAMVLPLSLLWVCYSVDMVLLWFCYDFATIVLWLSGEFTMIVLCFARTFAPDTLENVSSGSIYGGCACGVGAILAPRFGTIIIGKRKLRNDLWWSCLCCWRHVGAMVSHQKPWKT